jgi:deoxyribose-phosphate aldolase
MIRIDDANELAHYIEYANLDNTSTEEDILKFLKRAKAYEFYSILIMPCYVELAKEALKDTDIKVGTVVGFPLGFETTEAKIAETKIALESGADEIEMVINPSYIKSNNFEAIESEIKEIKHILGDKVLKVIIESKLLEDSEKIEVSKIAQAAGADYVRTTTGFNEINTSLETLHDINLIKKHAPIIKIKAAGGINDYKLVQRVLSTGADKVGSYSGYEIVREFQALIKSKDQEPPSII